MLGDDKCTFNIVAIQCASDTLRQSWKGGLSTSSGMPYSRCTIQMMIQLCRTWFSSPVTAQGLRRVKEYARLGLLSATLQLEMDHMMVFSHRWLPAAWESLNDALPKCREFRVKVDSNLMDLVLSSIFLDQLETHLEQVKPLVQGKGPGLYCKPLKVACVTNRNGQQKIIFLKPEEIVKSFAHLTRPPYQCLA